MSRLNRTGLIMAIAGGDDVLAIELVTNRFDIETTDDTSMTPLMFAVTYDRKLVFDCLLAHGVNVNTTTRAGRNALMIAAIKGSVSYLRGLLDAGAVLDHVSVRGETALSLAQRFNHPLCSDFLSSVTKMDRL